MGDKFKTKLNPYFHLGLLAWVITGAVLMMTFDQRQLFSFFNSHYTTFGNYLMYGITFMGQPEVIIPVLLGLMLLIKEYRNRWFFITAIACNITPLLVQQTMKHFLYHPRPLKYYSHADWIHFEKGLWPELTGNNSFPSGHSQGAFSFFCFLSLLLPPRYQAWGFIFFCLALQVCYSRIYLAAHFFADVFTGSVIGAVTTTLMFSILYPLKDKLSAQKGLM